MPGWGGAAVIVTLRLLFVPPNTIEELFTSHGLSETPETTRLPAGVSASDTVKAMGGVVPPEATATFAIEEIAGGWLEAPIVANTSLEKSLSRLSPLYAVAAK